jgi:hypothetical protein
MAFRQASGEISRNLIFSGGSDCRRHSSGHPRCQRRNRQTPSRLPPRSMPCPLSSRPARRRIHRRPPPQCRQAALRGSRAVASSRITIRNRARPERTAAIRRPRKRHRARRANSRQIPTRRPRPLPTTASLRRKTARRPTPRTRPIPIRLRNRTRQIRMRWGRPPIPAKSRHLRQPTIPRNNRQATRKAKTMPRRPTPRQRPQRRQTRPIRGPTGRGGNRRQQPAGHPAAGQRNTRRGHRRRERSSGQIAGHRNVCTRNGERIRRVGATSRPRSARSWRQHPPTDAQAQSPGVDPGDVGAPSSDAAAAATSDRAAVKAPEPTTPATRALRHRTRKQRQRKRTSPPCRISVSRLWRRRRRRRTHRAPYHPQPRQMRRSPSRGWRLRSRPARKPAPTNSTSGSIRRNSGASTYASTLIATAK